MLVGSCIQSTRGCDSAPLIDTVRQALASGKQFRLLTMSSIPKHWLVAAVQGLGGGGAWDYVLERVSKQNLDSIDIAEQNLRVLDLLADFMGTDVRAIIRSEAADATATALLIAAQRDIPILDADYWARVPKFSNRYRGLMARHPYRPPSSRSGVTRSSSRAQWMNIASRISVAPLPWPVAARRPLP